VQKIISVDCGLKGGLASFLGSKLDKVMPMPTKGGKIDSRAIYELLMLSGVDLVILEQQFNPTGKAQKGSFFNAENFGILKACCDIAQIPYKTVLATKWKPFFNLSNVGRSPLLPKVTKKDSVNLANSKYDLTLKYSQDGLAEAVLIGHYWLRMQRG
jgi:hypothetical protein